MAYIELVPEAPPSSPEEAVLEAGRAHLGYVPNYARAFAHRPAVFQAWLGLNGALKATMDQRRYELVSLAAARRLRSSYCSLAHGSVLADEVLGDRDAVRVIATDPLGAALDPVDRAVMALAEQVVDDAAAVSEDQVAKLRELGLSDAEIFDVVAAASARCFFAKTLDGLGVQPDPPFAEIDPELRTALTVGRPIQED
jgi:uncharacterized peroxidase-related enzyme